MQTALSQAQFPCFLLHSDRQAAPPSVAAERRAGRSADERGWRAQLQ